MTTPQTLPLTINRETRNVAVRDTFGNGSALDTVEQVGLAKVGRSGTKLWPSGVRFWRQDDGSYRANLTANHIRLPGRIIAWNDASLDAYKSRRDG